MNNEIIHIGIVFNDSDGEYTKRIFPTLFSILENNQEEDLKIYLICKGLKEEYKKYIQEIFDTYNQEYMIIDDFGDKEYLVKYFKEVNPSSWNYGIFFKLLLPFLLPTSLSKVINFDSDDVLINSSLREMWNIDLHDKLIASVKGYRNENTKVKFDLKEPIFRIGGNIYNLEAIRKTSFEEEFKNIIHEYGSRLTTPESDILNILWNEKVLYINEKFNFVPREYNIFSDGMHVYHFNDKKFFIFKMIFGVNKKYKKMYYKYYTMSKYKFKRKGNFIRSLNSIGMFNIIIRKLSIFFEYLGIRSYLVKKLYG